MAAMGGLDMIVFTGGIGENSNTARKLIMQGLECFGIDFDFEFNDKAPRSEFCELQKRIQRLKW